MLLNSVSSLLGATIEPSMTCFCIVFKISSVASLESSIVLGRCTEQSVATSSSLFCYNLSIAESKILQYSLC